MKIMKLAQGIPEGFVKIRITIGRNGKFEAKYIREGKSTCSSEAGKELQELLDTEVPGFIGGFGDATDAGKTKEYYEQTRVKTTPIPETPEEESPMAAPQAPQRAREYGV